MPDSFDHREGEEPSDERLSLLGGDTERGGERLGNGEEEEEFQARCEDFVMSETSSPEAVLLKNRTAISSPSVEEATKGHTAVFLGEGHAETNEWQCDYPSCGRFFQKRHDLKQVPLSYYTPKPTINLTQPNLTTF